MLLISPWKFFLFSTYLNFCPKFFGHLGKWLNKKAKVDFKIYDVFCWETNNCNTHVSRSKGNQTMKFDQLIEYNLRNIYLEELNKNRMEILVPNPFLKHQNWAYLWINSLKFCTICFYCMSKLRTTKSHVMITCFYST